MDNYHFYRPRLPNGKIAPLSFEVRIFFTNIDWPIIDEATWRMRLYDRLSLIAGFLTFMVINEAEMHYIVANRNDLGRALEGMATYLILIEQHARIFGMAFRKPAFKHLIKEFFLKIYIERSSQPKLYKKIKRSLLPTRLCSYSYIVTLISYVSIPVRGFFTNERLLPFRMVFHYDHTQLLIYLPTLLVTLWIGVAVVGQLVAESNLLATMILHLNGRYELLQQDVRELYAQVTRSTRSEEMLREFRRRFIKILRRNGELNEFAGILQAQYSFTIFVMMALSAVLLCVLGFKAVTIGMSSENITYISWIIGKIVELVVFGELGSTLIHTTDALSVTYYLCNWEDIILNSSNVRENCEMMKLITLAISLNQKPFYLSGFNFFSVSLVTVITILQGAGSYFTCLYAFR